MTITELENRMIEAVSGLGLFAQVSSAGRAAAPMTYGYPACFVFFAGDDDTGSNPRPVDLVEFKAVVQAQNLAGEAVASQDIYSLIDTVRGIFRGKTLTIQEITPFKCASRKLT